MLVLVFVASITMATSSSPCSKESAAEVDLLSSEIQRFWSTQHDLPMSEDPLSFWNAMVASYPRLAAFAQDILCIPATSAPVERLFSQAAVACGGKRNRLSGIRLEREVMMKVNKRFF